ncbi:Glycosyltransferase involved in cell wall bisynthesis [Jatrophihabitans endophyticus]|uniref:Glycosyltransferase involved in cell wall bisynthesis n=1 Tax=Jatrophihabitans endophyticus TaxID=1206085 RepID=A0A1M5GTB1_9ACTN|nr:glycosyltransferase family 2 protein [Jatrophihabitans endophyticus]SHG06979.1 Glycosyltransferase involved in cell wall bisynthesis [Jatrophihabitans endophyticus]
MTVRVSVVVAVYNTGKHIEPLVASLLGQSLPAAQFEVIFVDDGSTDATPARLDALAAEHDNVVVRHIPNSGWPGKPRNIGIDLARGTYVFFADHDDWFAPEALERLADYADDNGADVVVGRYAGHRRGVAKALFAKSRPDATLANAPLMDSLTPHKLFRVAFLNEIGLRFPEGKRRLEDHVFVVEAYFRARRISVLADYHVYFHIGRQDAGNAGYQRIDPPSYYGYVRETVDIILRHTEPGALRDKCLRRPLRQEILGRLDGASFLAQDRDYQRSLFDAARALAEAAIPPHVDAGLSPRQRVAAELLRAGRLDDLIGYVRHQLDVRCRAELTGLGWNPDGTLALRFAAVLVDAHTGDPRGYDRSGDDFLVPVPPLDPPVTVAARRCTRELRSASITLVARRRADSLEFTIATESAADVRDDGSGRSSLALRGSATIDPRVLAEKPDSVWDFYLKLAQTGWSKEGRLGGNRTADVPSALRPALAGGVAVVPYWTQRVEDLSLRVGVDGAALARALRFGPGPGRVGRRAGTVTVTAPLVVADGDDVGARLRLMPPGRPAPVDVVARLVRDADTTALTAPLPRPRRRPAVWRVLLALDLPGWGAPRPTGTLVLTGGRRVLAALPDPELAGPTTARWQRVGRSLARRRLRQARRAWRRLRARGRAQ